MTACADTARMDALGIFGTASADELARLAMTSVRTARRWLREKRAPRLVLRWLRLIVRGDLGELHPDWSGFELRRDGRLHVCNASVRGYAWTPHDLYAMLFRCINSTTGVAEIARLERELSAAREQIARAQQERQQQPAAPVSARPHDDRFKVATYHVDHVLPARTLRADDFPAAR